MDLIVKLSDKSMHYEEDRSRGHGIGGLEKLLG